MVVAITVTLYALDQCQVFTLDNGNGCLSTDIDVIIASTKVTVIVLVFAVGAKRLILMDTTLVDTRIIVVRSAQRLGYICQRIIFRGKHTGLVGPEGIAPRIALCVIRLVLSGSKVCIVSKEYLLALRHIEQRTLAYYSGEIERNLLTLFKSASQFEDNSSFCIAKHLLPRQLALIVIFRNHLGGNTGLNRRFNLGNDSDRFCSRCFTAQEGDACRQNIHYNWIHEINIVRRSVFNHNSVMQNCSGFDILLTCVKHNTLLNGNTGQHDLLDINLNGCIVTLLGRLSCLITLFVPLRIRELRFGSVGKVSILFCQISA